MLLFVGKALLPFISTINPKIYLFSPNQCFLLLSLLSLTIIIIIITIVLVAQYQFPLKLFIINLLIIY